MVYMAKLLLPVSNGVEISSNFRIPKKKCGCLNDVECSKVSKGNATICTLGDLGSREI